MHNFKRKWGFLLCFCIVCLLKQQVGDFVNKIADSACKNTGEFSDDRIYEVVWSEGDDGCGKGGGVPFGT